MRRTPKEADGWNLRVMTSAMEILAEIHGFWKTKEYRVLIKIDNEQEWLEERRKYLTASDAGSYCGINPFDKNGKLTVWEEKTGRKDRPSIGNSEAVKFGKDAEDILRQLFMLTHPDWELEYNQFTLQNSVGEMNFGGPKLSPSQEELAAMAQKIQSNFK